MDNFNQEAIVKFQMLIVQIQRIICSELSGWYLNELGKVICDDVLRYISPAMI